jgi:hypothetical protein
MFLAMDNSSMAVRAVLTETGLDDRGKTLRF